MIAPCGTFDYVTTVPENPLSSAWDLTLRQPVQSSGNEMWDKRLVGYAPKLQITDFGLRPDTPDWQNMPRVMLSKITLVADRRELALQAAFSFFLDSSIFAWLRSGDCVYLSRTLDAGLGISAFRDRQLIFAVGAVLGVPLGDFVKVDVQGSFAEAEAIIGKDYPGFHFPEYPLGIHIGDQKQLCYTGFFEINEYEGFVWRGISRMPDAPSECMAVCLKGSCSSVGANASAQLLNFCGPLEMADW